MLAEQYDMICNRMCSIGGANLTGMPHNPSPNYDKIAIDVSLKEDTLERLNEKKREYIDERSKLIKIISKLGKANEKQVLLSRYIYNNTWPEVAKIVYGSCKDFDTRYDDYVGYARRTHSRAILHLNEILRKG